MERAFRLSAWIADFLSITGRESGLWRKLFSVDQGEDGRR